MFTSIINTPSYQINPYFSKDAYSQRNYLRLAAFGIEYCEPQHEIALALRKYLS